MVLKRKLSGEGDDTSFNPGNQQNSGPNFRRINGYGIQGAFLQQLIEELQTLCRHVVRQELEKKLALFRSSPRWSLSDQPGSSASRILQLQCANKVPSLLYTNNRVLAEGNDFIQVRLIDAISKDVIIDSPLCSIKVEILVLDGDFAVEEHEHGSENALMGNILRGRDGKPPLLVGEISFSLVQGVGFINNIMFTDNSSWRRSRKFRLGIRAVPSASNGIMIEEAISEPFVVLDHRGESYKKHKIPHLDDPVWRFKRISKGGAIEKRLAEHGMYTVKDFLQLFHTSPDLLRKIIGNGVANKAWETMIKHANACVIDNSHYMYYSVTDGFGILLNCVYKILQVTFDGIDYQPIDILDTNKMVVVEHLKQFVYENPSELRPVNSSLGTSVLTEPQVQANGTINEVWSSDVLQRDQDMDELGKLVGFNHLEISTSNLYTADDSYCRLEEDNNNTAQSRQPIVEGSMLWNSTPQFAEEAYNRRLGDSIVESELPNNSPFIFYESICLEDSRRQQQTLTVSTDDVNIEPLSSLSNLGLNGISRGGSSPRGRWGKIRAVLLWRAVKRYTDAKRKGRFPVRYY